MKCARCQRNVSKPVLLGGMSFGTHCASLVRGPVRRPAEPAPARVVDPRQRDLFQEARP